MATSPSSFTKQPFEEFPIEVDFTKQLLVDEEITEIISVKAYNEANSDVTSEIIAGSSIDSGKKKVEVGVKGGATDNNYKISAQVKTNNPKPDSTDSFFEADVTMVVKEL